jgi:hypothetical protein
MIDLNELPDRVNAADEDLFREIITTLCDARGMEPRIVTHTAILDEYHDVPSEETYEEYIPEGYEYPDILWIPAMAMIAYAEAELDYYSSHDPREHEDGDVTKPSKRASYGLDDEPVPACQRCELDEQLAFEDQLIALGLDARIDLLRAYLDQFMPTEYEPYEINPYEHNYNYYSVTHNGQEIGGVQFNERLDRIACPLVPGPLFDIQQRHFGRPTNEDRMKEIREQYPHLYED